MRKDFIFNIVHALDELKVRQQFGGRRLIQSTSALYAVEYAQDGLTLGLRVDNTRDERMQLLPFRVFKGCLSRIYD